MNEDILDTLAREGNLRTLPEIEIRGTEIIHNGRSYLNLSSNDYLGIASGDTHTRFMKEAAENGEFLLSNPSSRLITGNGEDYQRLEKLIGSIYGDRAALVLGSGYLLNSGILPAVTSKEDIILADKLVHASIIDGLRLCEAQWHRYSHNDMGHLESLIRKYRPQCRDLYIVTESLFSMDGDFAPVEDIVRLKERYGCKIYLDEAHAFGVCGPDGLGIAAQAGADRMCDILVATMGKSIASQGAFAVTDATTRELLVNRMRTLIFSTALPPISLKWSEYIISRLPEMEQRREHLRELNAVLRAQSHIIPIMAGDNCRALEMSEQMREAGYWVTPIRYPTVAKGAARIRISLNAGLPTDKIEQFADLCKSLK